MDAFGVERVSKRQMMPEVEDRKDAGATYDKGKAEAWAKAGYRVTARDNANGRSYARVGIHPNVPAKTRRVRRGAGLGERIKTKIVGRDTYKPDYTKVQYEKGPGTIDGKVYRSRAVSKGYLGIGDHPKVRAAKWKQERSRANTDLAAGATLAGVSPLAIQQYNKHIQPRRAFFPVVPQPKGSLPGLRQLKLVKAGMGMASLSPKAKAVISHPGTMAGITAAVGVPLTIANYREHQRDEKRVKRLEVRYPKKGKKK